MGFYNILVYVISFLGLFLTIFYALNIFFDRKDVHKINKEFLSTTIIIPAYNEEKSIAATIKSALAINYPSDKFEIVVINDGSIDKTYEIAKQFESSVNPQVRVFSKPNGGKGSALNFAIAKARGEIIITMDADSFVNKDTVKEMIAKFYSPQVMSVTPAMLVHNPKTVWQKIQQIEYNLGVFLRNAFSTINSVHVTPGAFSAYRKRFFELHGGYDEDNITEDLEIALRIQSHHYIIENAPKAVVYTIAPFSFGELLVQRRRWYSGLIRNLIKYYHLFGPKYGILGIVVLPLAVLTVFSTIILTSYTLSRSISSFMDNLYSFSAINFDFKNFFSFNKFALQYHAYGLFSQQMFVIFLVFVIFLSAIVIFAKKQTKFKDSFSLGLLLFIFTFSFLFSFWWIVSFIYLIFNKKIVWRDKKNYGI